MRYLAKTKYAIAAMITITAVVVFVFVLAHATLGFEISNIVSSNSSYTKQGASNTSASAVSNAYTSSSQQGVPSTWPKKLIIPSLKISAHVQYVGRTASGAMGVPTNFTDVAWFREGTIPGDAGVALLDGHVDNGLALPGVFKHLSSIKSGADIYLTEENGKKLHFKVKSVDLYPYNDPQTASIITAPDGDKHLLRLITCEGSWVASDKTYNKRLVVTAELVV